MADFTCSTCGKRPQSAASSVSEDTRCHVCGASIAAGQSIAAPVTGIATPEHAAQVKVASPLVASDGAFADGLPPLLPRPMPSERPSQLARVIAYTFFAILVLSILGVGIPAVMRVREADARMQSITNLKQIVLAAQAFNDANKYLPFNGSSEGGYSLNAAGNQQSSGSWGFQIAPFLDEHVMFKAGTSNKGVAKYMCPGRGRPLTMATPAVGAQTPPWSDYVINP